MSKIKVRDFDKGVEINNTFYPKNYFRILVEDSGVVRISEIENDKSLYIHNWDEFEAIDVNGDPVTIASISDLEDDVLVPFFFRISSGGGTGTGDVVGTTTSGANEIVLYSDATGKKIKTSNISITTTLGVDDTTVPTSKAVLDAIITQTYTSTTIPALQSGQEVDFVIDEFNNTYRYKVLTDTSALETPYTHPAKFLRISPHRSQFELKSLYRFFVAVSGTAPTYSSITYTYDGVNYSATAAFSATVGSILIYNYDTGLQVQAIALNNAKYLHYNTDNNKLYVSTDSNTIACYSPTGTLVGSYNIDNTVTLTGMSNIERVGVLQIAVYAWDSVTSNTFVYHVTLNANGTFATTIKQTANTGNNTAYSMCKYVASNNRLYCAASAPGSVSGARNKGYYMNLDIYGGAFVNTIVKVNLTDWESGYPYQAYSDLENIGNYMYLNCNYGIIRTDLDLANEKAILIDSTSNRFIDDIYTGRIKYVPGLNKLLVARYPKNTLIRGQEPMLVYQLDISEIKGFTATVNAARNVFISEFKATNGNINYDVNLVGVDEINNHIIVATKDVHIIKFYKF